MVLKSAGWFIYDYLKSFKMPVFASNTDIGYNDTRKFGYFYQVDNLFHGQFRVINVAHSRLSPAKFKL